MTEVLDVAPIDFLTGISKQFADECPDELVPAELKVGAVDFEFHWVSETGPVENRRLTTGISLTPTV